jgi:hypothetical protein
MMWPNAPGWRVHSSRRNRLGSREVINWRMVCPQHNARRIATSPVAIALLAALALAAQLLDLLTGLRMVLAYGIDAELNPLLRAALISAGPAGAAALKLGAATLSVAALVFLARTGRAQLARNCLLLAVDIGFVGALSNSSPGVFGVPVGSEFLELLLHHL